MTVWDPKLLRHVFEARGNNSTRVMREQGLSQPLWLPRDCFSELGKLSYFIWKRTSRATCWLKFFEFFLHIAIIQAWFWGVLGSANIPQHFGLSLCSLLEQIRLPYRKWKRTSLAIIWGMKPWSAARGCTLTAPIQFVTSTPSYRAWEISHVVDYSIMVPQLKSHSKICTNLIGSVWGKSIWRFNPYLIQHLFK